MGQVGGERVDDRHRPVRASQPHVDVHGEGLQPAGGPLELLDELRIALARRHLRIPPVAHRVRARAGQHDAVRFGAALQVLHRHGKVRLGFGHGPADPGHRLDGGLHQLVSHLGVLTAFLQARQARQQHAGILPEHARLRVDELHFPLDAERRTGRGVPLDRHDKPPDSAGAESRGVLH